jgi:serine/threonine protein phosphatase PrpC
MTRIRISAATHVGSVRRRNEDYYGATGLRTSLRDGEVVTVVADATCLAVLADGLGGHPSGEVASRLAVEQLLAANPTTPDALVAAFHEANIAIYGAMSREDGSLGMGTTAAAVLVTKRGLAIVNVGDSTVFELVDGRLDQLSTDDVPERGTLLAGLPSSIVTQTLGGRRELEEIEPHLYQDDFGTSRRVLLCTDGLTNFVTRDRIGDALRAQCGVAAVDSLVQAALDAGGLDNVTVVLLEPAAS